MGVRNRLKSGSLDYDLFVIDPRNENTTLEQLRECIYDALCVLRERNWERSEKGLGGKE